MGSVPEEPPSNDDLLDVAALADGSLAREREAAVRARIAESPELARAYAKQCRTIAAIRAAAVQAPPGLLSGGDDGPVRRRFRAPVAWLALALVVLVVAVVVLLVW